MKSSANALTFVALTPILIPPNPGKMLKKYLLAFGLLINVCSIATAQSNNAGNTNAVLNFIDGIQFSGATSRTTAKSLDKKDSVSSFTDAMKANLRQGLSIALESFLPFQFKYAILLNESVEKISNLVLYKTIDEWYGTRYRYGGVTEKGIDCSAFMQVLAGYAFGWMLPRTAREQYASMLRIAKDDLQEGDFVFFNTTGGISHVGMYLSNNKFVHSSSSQGVSIGDLNDSYWSHRFLGARRATQKEERSFLPLIN